ncbi:MAG: hypothetical protein JWR75_1470 [Devosia sp.]|nr:hypothetical protein [Devosia sp.]
MGSFLDRIISQSGVPDLLEVLTDRLNPTDLQTLLLAVAEKRSARRTTAAVLADYERSRFFGASPFSRSMFLKWDTAALKATEGRFETLTLSPMAPLASCAAVAPVGQGWTVPTVRTGEVVSDPTNILALEAAIRRKKGQADVNLATTHRVVRPQAYANPKMLAHFSMFGLLSTALDTGNCRTEAQAIGLHLETHLSIFRAFLGAEVPLSVSYTITSRGDDDARPAAVFDVGRKLSVDVWEEIDRPAVVAYYSGFCFHIWAELAGRRQQLSDGGTVDWVGRLIANAKERTLISGAGVEGALGLASELQMGAERS